MMVAHCVAKIIMMLRCTQRTAYLTCGVTADGDRSTARRGELAGGCTGQVEQTFRQRCSTSGRDDVSVIVSPHVTRLRITVRHTRQHATGFERFARRSHRH